MSLDEKCSGGCNVCTGKCKSYDSIVSQNIYSSQNYSTSQNNNYGGIKNGYSS